MPPLLEMDRVSKAFLGVPVLHQVSLSLDEGEVLGVVGENFVEPRKPPKPQNSPLPKFRWYFNLNFLLLQDKVHSRFRERLVVCKVRPRRSNSQTNHRGDLSSVIQLEVLKRIVEFPSTLKLLQEVARFNANLSC